MTHLRIRPGALTWLCSGTCEGTQSNVHKKAFNVHYLCPTIPQPVSVYVSCEVRGWNRWWWYPGMSGLLWPTAYLSVYPKVPLCFPRQTLCTAVVSYVKHTYPSASAARGFESINKEGQKCWKINTPQEALTKERKLLLYVHYHTWYEEKNTKLKDT